jgi:hypothetical protein
MAAKVGRIRVKTRWTKALGEAESVAYGDWNGNIEAI